MIIRVCRLGVVTLGPTWVRLDNRTTHTKIELDPAAHARWTAHLKNARRTKVEIDTPALPATHTPMGTASPHTPHKTG